MTNDSYAAEAKERWGDTDAFQESQRRLAKYSKTDVEKAGFAMQEATNLIIAAMRSGLPPTSVDAMAGAEAHRNAISDWWYECNYEIHIGLATMYLTDPRFKAHYEDQSPGLAKYIHDAIMANSTKHL